MLGELTTKCLYDHLKAFNDRCLRDYLSVIIRNRSVQLMHPRENVIIIKLIDVKFPTLSRLLDSVDN